VTILWNARLLDGTGAAARERAVVRIEAGRISEVGTADDTPPPDAIDLGGRTLLPGLIDAHAHVSSDTLRSPGFGPLSPLHGELPRPRALGYFILTKSARAMLAAGITTVRDVGSYHDEGIALREAVRLGIVEGPRILCCGRIISATAPGGAIFKTMYREADGPDDMRKAVREQLRRGADFIKLMATGARSVVAEDPEPAQMTALECRAIVDEAHRLGVRVAAHAEGLQGTRMAVEEGVDTIEHGLSLHREPSLLAAMAERGIVLVPTLSTFHDLADRFTGDFAPALVEQAKRQKEEAYSTLVAARDAGVTLAMGHDSGPPGDNAIELVRMVDGGLTAIEGIVAATRGSAAALGRDDLGTVTAGAVADLLVVDGDPLGDIRVLNDPGRVWLVVQGGRIVAGDRGRIASSTPGPAGT
jgi:imidazolonepropionase-like amidohydrolase